MINAPITSQYFESTCNIDSARTDAKGHIEITEAGLYTSLPCHAYNVSTTKLDQILGISNKGRYKFQFPLTFSEADVVIDEGYVIYWTDKRGVARELEIETIEYKDSHIEAEAAERNLV